LDGYIVGGWYIVVSPLLDGYLVGGWYIVVSPLLDGSWQEKE
jgi:hypothetical protein